MKNKVLYVTTALLAVVVLYLFTLGIDVFRLQRRKPLPGIYAVRVFNNGWHTGLVLEVPTIPPPFQKHFMPWRKHRWVEVSWGDNRFYRNRRPAMNWLLALEAIAWPTKSVLHVVGFDLPLNHLYGKHFLQTVYVTRENYLSLLRFVSSFFVGDSVHPFAIIERGLYGDSYFLKSKGMYVFPFTCNVWTARALKAAGLPLTPVLYQTSGLLMRVLRERAKNYPRVGKDVRYVHAILPVTGNRPER